MFGGSQSKYTLCSKTSKKNVKNLVNGGTKVNMENQDFDFEEGLTTRKHIDLFHMYKRTDTRWNGHNIFSCTKFSVSPTYVQKRHLALGSNASILKESPFLRKCINENKSLAYNISVILH